jgi:hypothetical protein
MQNDGELGSMEKTWKNEKKMKKLNAPRYTRRCQHATPQSPHAMSL